MNKCQMWHHKGPISRNIHTKGVKDAHWTELWFEGGDVRKQKWFCTQRELPCRLTGIPNKHTLAHQCTRGNTHTLTGLLVFGATWGFLRLTPDGNAILQQLQRSSLLPARRPHLKKQRTIQQIDSSACVGWFALTSLFVCNVSIITFTMLEPCNILFTSSSSWTPGGKMGPKIVDGTLKKKKNQVRCLPGMMVSDGKSQGQKVGGGRGEP